MPKSQDQAETDWKEREALFAKYAKGDDAAARPLFSSLMKALQGYFHARIGSGEDAEDLLQATLLKIHFSRDRYDPTQPLKTWIFTIASRTLIDHWRGASAEAILEDSGSGEGDGLSPLASLPSELLSPEGKTQLHRDLNQALATLKPLERSIVYLYGVEGLSMAEIAAVHSLSEGAAKLRAHRAYQELRKILGILLVIAWGTRFFGME